MAERTQTVDDFMVQIRDVPPFHGMKWRDIRPIFATKEIYAAFIAAWVSRSATR